ncbi:hypothetical protein H6F86_27110 [Phormidium sp. FACHB-592]|uniref:Sel1 repeat family protein n=1 Tax=Stenomitos frigidus AS-A4 TaxID=2933935 RepID=A0ABV0KCU3_9CYAN|nr:hypothetical protein [Phormidium sp. FACHB-592]MBD2077486.1 hypothetical protein [Phormidium sp. FACHB-592]
MDNSELQKRHFAALREKYQVDQYKSARSDSFLYLILRKAELGIQITNLELQWLKQNSLFKAIEIVSLQQYQADDFKRLEIEFLSLRPKYKIPETLELSIASPIYPILWKLEVGDFPADSELELLDSYDLVETTSLIRDILNFSKLKTSYKATRHLGHFFEEPLYAILKKLDAREPLSDFEADWLLDRDFEETLQIHWQQEDERKAIVKFLDLKAKYRIDSFPEASISSPLYITLKKLEEKQDLEKSECEWLEQQELTQLIAIDRKRKDVKFFKKLKAKYQATQYKSSEPSSKLFLILKNIESEITEDDIQWLLKEALLKTAEIAKEHHFRILKVKYQIVGQLAVVPFYEIMLKLERGERLDPKQVIQLIEERRLSRHGKIAIAYYKLEAMFYEKEYQRTGNRWNLPSASSNWRKADESENALKVTESVNWNKIQESDLKAALLVTRGAAFRDLGQLDEAEKCVAQAMECQSDSHQPYTLMGAIYYDRCEYSEGDKWFEMAAERGADDTDDEIERIVRMTKDKDKRRDVAEYLLNKDPVRYGWATSYLK